MEKFLKKWESSFFSKTAGCNIATLLKAKSLTVTFQGSCFLSCKLWFFICSTLRNSNFQGHLSLVISDLWLFLIYMQMCDTNFGTVPLSKRYTDNTVQERHQCMGNKDCFVDSGLLHKDQWTKTFKEYITFSLCACTRKRLTNCSKMCRINH